MKVSNLESDWSELAKHHSTSMSRIGGIAKSFNQFLALKDTLSPNNMCRLYVAYRGAEFAGALLNLYYEEWVEYFAPVSVERFRGEQVMSALIATAMSDAILEGRRYWNWGGTWLTQSGVYHFKKGWGAKDHLYAYCGAVFDKELEKRQSSELLAAFPLFFVRPFDLVGAVSK